MAKRKVLTITIEFELDERKAGSKRLDAVYDAAVEAPSTRRSPNSLRETWLDVRHRMTFDYRWTERNSATSIGGSDDWDDEQGLRREPTMMEPFRTVDCGDIVHPSRGSCRRLESCQGSPSSTCRPTP
jgi:hypothetical protein